MEMEITSWLDRVWKIPEIQAKEKTDSAAFSLMCDKQHDMISKWLLFPSGTEPKNL